MKNNFIPCWCKPKQVVMGKDLVCRTILHIQFLTFFGMIFIDNSIYLPR